MHGRARIARLMLESEYRSDIINAKSNDGWTPLHVAAHYGRDSFVRLLLEFKAEVDPLSDKGTTPLQLAIIRERSSCVKILLDHNANIDIQNGFLLRYAVIKSNHSYCRMFLQRGADTNLGRLEDGQTPLHLSALRDDVLCAQMLYNYGADTNTRNYEGQTPLAVSISISGSSRPCLDFLQEVTSMYVRKVNDGTQCPLKAFFEFSPRKKCFLSAPWCYLNALDSFWEGEGIVKLGISYLAKVLLLSIFHFN